MAEDEAATDDVVVECDLKFVESGSLGTIKFNTTCRQVAVEPITVSNPLSTAAY